MLLSIPGKTQPLLNIRDETGTDVMLKPGFVCLELRLQLQKV